jgi:malate/lactate dehydrogenase
MIGAGGVEKVIEVELTPREKEMLQVSLSRVRDIVQAMDKILAAG